MPSTSNNYAAGGVWIRACPSSTRASWGISARRLRPLLREIAAGSRHLFRAPAQLAQARLRGLLISIIIGIPLGMLSALKVNTWWDSAGKVIALLGCLCPASSSAWSSSSFGVQLHWLPVLGKGPSAFIWSNPSTWMPVLVSGLAVLGHAGVCFGLVLLRGHAADHPPECSMSSAATTSSLCA